MSQSWMTYYKSQTKSNQNQLKLQLTLVKTKINQLCKSIRIQTHFLANGKNGHKMLISIDGTMSESKSTAVEGASHTLLRILGISAVSMDVL